MAGRSRIGWSALIVVVGAFAASQHSAVAPIIQDAKQKLQPYLPSAFVSAGNNPGATTPAAGVQGQPSSGGSAVGKTASAPAPGQGNPPGKRAIPPAPVRTDVAQKANIPLRLDGVGTVTARSTVGIKARIDGQLMEAAVKEGQMVAKGDLLFRLDARPFEAALRVAEANVGRDKATLERAKADYGRVGDLASKGFSPKAKFDEVKASMNALEATIKAGEAAIDAAKLNLEYTAIRAPVAGRVGNLLVHPGNMVKANDTQSLIVLTEVAPVYVAFAVAERYLPEIKRLMAERKVAVEVWTPENKTERIQGELFFMNNAVDTTTGTITLMATFANADQRLMPGQFVQASASLGGLENVTVVPSRAVQIGQRGTFVYVVKDDLSAEMRPVIIGETVDDRSVISSGISPGERIVTEGQLRIAPGGKVAPKDGPTAGAKAKEQS